MAVDTAAADFAGTGSGRTPALLGIDQPAGVWPTVPRLKSYEAAGFTHVQVRMPPRALLADAEMVRTHARALRDAVALTGLRLILHAPDDLLAGSAEHDEQLAGALDYAALAGSSIVVYHGARLPAGLPGLPKRLGDEERSLRRLLDRAGSLGVRLAIENLAPVYPGSGFVSHDPAAVARLVRALGHECAGMCLDIGHAHIVAGLTGRDLGELIAPVLDTVLLFHVHDNFGAAGRRQRSGGIEPLRLDLHLAPGAGTVPWGALSAVLARHAVPLQLEVHPPARPEPATLGVVVRELLALSSPPASRRT